MAKEAEAAFQSAANLRIGRLPGAVFGKGSQPVEAEAVGDGLEAKIGERRRRFADRKTRMRSAFEQGDGQTLPASDQGEEGAAKARAENRDVAIDPGHGVNPGESTR